MRRILLAFGLIVGLVTVASAQSASRWFEIDALNPGLGPTDVDRETPRAALESFVAAAAAERFDEAAHLLDLREFATEDQAALGPMLARQLHEVIERKLWLDFGDYPDRPDGLDATASKDNPLAGEVRRSYRLAILDLDGRPVPVRLNRVKPRDGDPAWVFSRQTVENVPRLHESYGPTDFERALPASLRAEAFWRLRWWEVVALPLLVVGALAAGALVYRLLGRARRVAADEDRDDGDERASVIHRVASGLQLPLALVAAGLVFSLFSSRLLVFSGPINAFLEPLLVSLFVIAGIVVLVRVVDAFLDVMIDRRTDDLGDEDKARERELYTNVSAARRVVVLVAVLIGAGLVLIQMNAFETIGMSMIASAGVLGLILGFAARTALSNIMASLQIALSKSAKIGEAVQFEGEWCYVERINFTYVQLRSWDKRRIIVPVTYFTSEPFENWTKRDPRQVMTCTLTLDHRADVSQLRKAHRAFVEADPDAFDNDEAKVLVIDHDAQGMKVRFYAEGPNQADAWAMHCRMREAMIAAAAHLESVKDPRPAYLPRQRELHVGDLGGAERGGDDPEAAARAPAAA